MKPSLWLRFRLDSARRGGLRGRPWGLGGDSSATRPGRIPCLRPTLPHRPLRCCVPSRAGSARWPRGLRTSGSLRPVPGLVSENVEPSYGVLQMCRRWGNRVSLPRATLEFTMVFVLDNYDSFTYNLVQYLGELGAEVEVYRNDELTVEQVEALKPERILLSPGPCTPGEAGILVPLIRHMAGKAPILGVCLGHQAIGEAFGGRVVRAHQLMHGKTR